MSNSDNANLMTFRKQFLPKWESL